MANFGNRLTNLRFAAEYLGEVRWLFHGQQDRWMGRSAGALYWM